jgi:two-component system, NtrC family, sensor kinase
MKQADAADRISAADAAALADRVNSAKLATLGMLVAGVAHEINTPLGAIHSNHDVLRRALGRLQGILADEVVDESELEEVRRIVRALNDVMQVNTLAVQRMVQIVGSLRTFGRLDRAQIDFMDLHEGIDSALALLEHEMRGRVTAVREYGELPRVKCYPQQINQLFMNLLVNAVQAIRGPGTLTVRTRALDDDRVQVEIEDTGTGIPAENLERIFEPGFTTKGARVGMGLGLLISQQIVEEHGGRIVVRSTVGQGTAFTVMLPISLRSEPVQHSGDGKDR